MRFYRNNLFLVTSVSREYHNDITQSMLSFTMSSQIQQVNAFPNRLLDYALWMGTPTGMVNRRFSMLDSFYLSVLSYVHKGGHFQCTS
jgi:hypothetical protein